MAKFTETWILNAILMSEFQVTGEMIHCVMIHCVRVCVEVNFGVYYEGPIWFQNVSGEVWCSRAKFYENHNKHSGITERNFS